MGRVNRTLLPTLLSQCRQVLDDYGGEDFNRTLPGGTAVPMSGTGSEAVVSTSRETYDNAYCYILFVMVFYSFLAVTLFKCMGGEEENADPNEEFINSGKPSAKGHMAEKFYFEEEGSL